MSREVKFLYSAFLRLHIQLEHIMCFKDNYITWGLGNMLKPSWLMDGLGDVLDRYGLYKETQ